MRAACGLGGEQAGEGRRHVGRDRDVVAAGETTLDEGGARGAGQGRERGGRVVGQLSVIVGYHVWIGLPCIMLFLVPVTLLMHNYWVETDMMQRINQRVNFQKNVALLGAALMMLMISKPWPLSLRF